MRIGLNITDPQLVSAEQAKKSATAPGVQSQPSPAGDTATLSTRDNVSLSSLATRALSQPEVRQSQVDSLRQSISNGDYQLDPGGIADAILGR
jgi:flagellar biosynthesis anti-sigma factor FlgM